MIASESISNGRAPAQSPVGVVTGAAGFIGMHTCARLLALGWRVVGIDNLNSYYDPALKYARLAQLHSHPSFSFQRIDITDRLAMQALFAELRPAAVIHLAAQAGVRHSLVDPHAYVDVNVHGFLNVLEGCRQQTVGHLVYASSSSVYGGNARLPFSEHDPVDHPVSLYAATKKADELMAHTYSHLFGIPTTGLRLFTVYGPWGRPDMALFLFTRAMLAGQPIDVYNHGRMQRDFTYIDDIVEGIVRVVVKPATPNPAFDCLHPDPASGTAPYRVFNLGNSRPLPLMDYIKALEQALGRQAVKNFLPMQPGDVPETAAEMDELDAWVGFRPSTPIAAGVHRFVDWYLHYHGHTTTAVPPEINAAS